jgi:hypothetical protein
MTKQVLYCRVSGILEAPFGRAPLPNSLVLLLDSWWSDSTEFLGGSRVGISRELHQNITGSWREFGEVDFFLALSLVYKMEEWFTWIALRSWVAFLSLATGEWFSSRICSMERSQTALILSLCPSTLPFSDLESMWIELHNQFKPVSKEKNTAVLWCYSCDPYKRRKLLKY